MCARRAFPFKWEGAPVLTLGRMRVTSWLGQSTGGSSSQNGNRPGHVVRACPPAISEMVRFLRPCGIRPPGNRFNPAGRHTWAAHRSFKHTCLRPTQTQRTTPPGRYQIVYQETRFVNRRIQFPAMPGNGGRRAVPVVRPAGGGHPPPPGRTGERRRGPTSRGTPAGPPPGPGW